MTTTTYVFPHRRPLIAISKRKLEELQRDDDWAQLKELEDGRVAVLQSELGFMEVSFHVAVYAPAPRPFQRDRLKLISSLEIEHAESAKIAFDGIS